MKVFDALPPESPRHGFLRTVSAWKDAALVEFGPEGTMHYAQSSIHGETDNLFTTGMEECHIIFGETGTLERAVRELDETGRYGMIVLTSSPVSEIIGTDLDRICWELQPQIRGKLFNWDRIPVEGTQNQGRRHGFELAAVYVKTLDRPQIREPGSFLVLGLDATDWNGRSDLNELRRMMGEYFGMTCRNDADGRYRLADLLSAQLVLVADQDAGPLADAAQEAGIPCIPCLAYGIRQNEHLVAAVSDALGRKPGPLWQEDLTCAGQALEEFRAAVRPGKVLRLCLSPERSRNLADFARDELGASADPVQEDRHLDRPPEDTVTLGSEVVCRLWPDAPSVCMAYPSVQQKNFSIHFPFLGIRGCENLLSVLYPGLSGTGRKFL